MNLPDTIIFLKGLPISWYWTLEDGHLTKKKKEELTSEEIIKVFCKGAVEFLDKKKNQPVGYFIYFEGINSYDITEGLNYKIIYFYPDDLGTNSLIDSSFSERKTRQQIWFSATVCHALPEPQQYKDLTRCLRLQVLLLADCYGIPGLQARDQRHSIQHL